MSILWANITNPLRYLASKSAALAPHGWTARHNSKENETAEKAMLEIIEDPKKFIDKDYMMNIYLE